MLVTTRSLILLAVPLVTIFGIFLLRRKKRIRRPDNKTKDKEIFSKSSEKLKNGYLIYDDNFQSYSQANNSIELSKTTNQSCFLDIECDFFEKDNIPTVTTTLPSFSINDSPPQTLNVSSAPIVDYSYREESKVLPFHEDQEKSILSSQTEISFISTQHVECTSEDNQHPVFKSWTPYMLPSSCSENCKNDECLEENYSEKKSSTPKMDCQSCDIFDVPVPSFIESENPVNEVKNWNITVNINDSPKSTILSTGHDQLIHTSNISNEQECSADEQISPDSGIFVTENQEFDCNSKLSSEDTSNDSVIQKISHESVSFLLLQNKSDANFQSDKLQTDNQPLILPSAAHCEIESHIDSVKANEVNLNCLETLLSMDTYVKISHSNIENCEHSESSHLKNTPCQKEYMCTDTNISHSELCLSHSSEKNEKYTGVRRKQRQTNINNNIHEPSKLAAESSLAPEAIPNLQSSDNHHYLKSSLSDKNIDSVQKHFTCCHTSDSLDVHESSCQSNGWGPEETEYNSSQYPRMQPHKGSSSTDSQSYLNQDSTDQDEIWEIRFYLPPDYSGRLIGRGGRRIRHLRETTHTSVYVNTIDDIVDDTQVCVIRGHKENAKRALAEIEILFPNIEIRSTYHVFLQNTTILFPDNTFEAKISYIQDMNCIFIQQPHHPCFHNLSILENELQTHCSAVAPPPRPIALNCIYGAQLQMKWCRISIVAYNREADEVDGFFVDHGGYIHIPVSSLRPLQLKHADLPNLASECRLANLMPANGQYWQVNDVSFLSSLAVDTQNFLRCKVQYYDEYGLPYLLFFRYDSEKKTFICINRELEREGIALWV